MGAVLTAIGIGVAAAAYLLVGAYWTSQAGKQSSLWLALSAAKDEKEMADLARKNSGTYLGAVAQLDMARAQLAMALREFPVAPPNDTPIITAPGADKEKDKAANDKKNNENYTTIVNRMVEIETHGVPEGKGRRNIVKMSDIISMPEWEALPPGLALRSEEHHV